MGQDMSYLRGKADIGGTDAMIICSECARGFGVPGYILQEYKIQVGVEHKHGISKPIMKIVGYIAKPICPFCNSLLYDQPCKETSSKETQ